PDRVLPSVHPVDGRSGREAAGVVGGMTFHLGTALLLGGTIGLLGTRRSTWWCLAAAGIAVAIAAGAGATKDAAAAVWLAGAAAGLTVLLSGDLDAGVAMWLACSVGLSCAAGLLWEAVLVVFAYAVTARFIGWPGSHGRGPWRCTSAAPDPSRACVGAGGCACRPPWRAAGHRSPRPR